MPDDIPPLEGGPPAADTPTPIPPPAGASHEPLEHTP